jgi:hypothetical protein
MNYQFKLGADLASRVIKKMLELGYKVFTDDELNIIYLEGIDADGTVNSDAPDLWNDLRTVIEVRDGVPIMLGSWKATTEPGLHYTHRPLNDGGAARIAFGQYKSWQMGIHKDHEALVQTGGAVTVCRDRNRDGLRTNDLHETGYFGINQHWGGDAASVGRWSAGCLVGQSRNGHREFMQLVKTDSRYRENSKYVFWTAVLDGSKL